MNMFLSQVVLRSCKLVPTMIIAVLYLRKRVNGFEFFFGAVISIGMVIFAWADFHVYPNYNPIGIILVLTSLIGDCFLPNLQERMYENGSSRVEMVRYIYKLLITIVIVIIVRFIIILLLCLMFYVLQTFFSNAMCLVFFTVIFTATGDLPAALAYMTANPQSILCV
jgi:drug/metabolite transporter (DMT)-like permease